jgi:hypothetical protein
VAPDAPNVGKSSPSGIADARPDTLVKITVCPTVGTVNSWPNDAAAAENAGTPGTIS